MKRLAPRFPVFVLMCLLLSASATVDSVLAQSARESSRAPAFRCPPDLRPRVDFWIDVFTKYGKNQVVLHHRNYPQAVYGSLDFTIESEVLSPGKLDAYKKKAIETEIADIRMAIRSLSQGKTPKTRLEHRVQQALSKVPGGSSKYKTALEDNMVRSQTGIREKYGEALKRSGRYMHLLVQIFVNEYGLPIELTRLPFIESSFDYTAYSSVGAAGIWQFMPRTAKGYGMKVGSIIDERRDVLEATRGAAKYLTFGYDQLKKWPLALTSYNHGVAGVRRKLKAHGTSDIIELIEDPGKQAFGFASANFWPEFLAALDVYDNYHRYFPGLVLDAPRHYTTYTLPAEMSVAYVSKKLGISHDLLQEYNYALSPSVWKGRYKIPRGYELRVPRNIASNVAALRTPEPVSQTSSIYGGARYRVRPGDSLIRISRKYGVSVSRIKGLNNLTSDTVYVGQILTVKAAEARSATSGAEGSNRKTGKYKVRSGDSLYEIADRFDMGVAELMHINDLRDATIHPGQTLRVYYAAAPVSTVSNVGSTGSSGKRSGRTVPAEYIVRAGDTLSTIASRHGISTRQLMQLNNLRSTRIRPGQKLKTAGSVKSGGARTQYVVRRGDTLWSVSRKFGLSISDLKKANSLRSNALYVGQKLSVP